MKTAAIRKPMRSKPEWRLLMRASQYVVMAIGALAGLFFFSPGASDSHQSNLQYIAWKRGIAPYDEDYVRFLGVDPEFPMSLRGKTKDEIRTWFPDLRAPEQNTNEYQDTYRHWFDGKDMLWIGESHRAIEFKDGRVVAFRLIKG